MIFEHGCIDGVFILKPEKKEDERGHFARMFCKKEFENHGIVNHIVNVNVSYNLKKGTLRGLHRQLSPNEETKIVRCTKGSIFDVAVDTREGSSTFGKYVAIELSEDNGNMLYIPKGFAHGYLTLSDHCEVMYLVDQFYFPESEMGYRYDEPLFHIEWPFFNDLTISKKDLGWKYL